MDNTAAITTTTTTTTTTASTIMESEIKACAAELTPKNDPKNKEALLAKLEKKYEKMEELCHRAEIMIAANAQQEDSNQTARLKSSSFPLQKKGAPKGTTCLPAMVKKIKSERVRNLWDTTENPSFLSTFHLSPLSLLQGPGARTGHRFWYHLPENSCYVFGGVDARLRRHYDLWRLDMGERTWSKLLDLEDLAKREAVKEVLSSLVAYQCTIAQCLNYLKMGVRLRTNEHRQTEVIFSGQGESLLYNVHTGAAKAFLEGSEEEEEEEDGNNEEEEEEEVDYEALLGEDWEESEEEKQRRKEENATESAIAINRILSTLANPVVAMNSVLAKVRSFSGSFLVDRAMLGVPLSMVPLQHINQQPPNLNKRQPSGFVYSFPLDHIVWSGSSSSSSSSNNNNDGSEELFIAGGYDCFYDIADEPLRRYLLSDLHEPLCQLDRALKITYQRGKKTAAVAVATKIQSVEADVALNGQAEGGSALFPPARYNAGTVQTDDWLFVVGGQATASSDLLRDIWALEKSTLRWRRLPVSLPLGLANAGVAADTRSGQLVIFGGRSSKDDGRTIGRDRTVNLSEFTLSELILTVNLGCRNTSPPTEEDDDGDDDDDDDNSEVDPLSYFLLEDPLWEAAHFTLGHSPYDLCVECLAHLPRLMSFRPPDYSALGYIVQKVPDVVDEEEEGEEGEDEDDPLDDQQVDDLLTSVKDAKMSLEMLKLIKSFVQRHLDAEKARLLGTKDLAD